MPDIYKLQGTVEINTGKAEASLKKVESGARGTQTALNRIDGRRVGREIASGFDKGAQSASRLSSVVSSLQAKIGALRGANIKFGSSGGSGSGSSIGDIVGGNLISGAISSAISATGGALKQAMMDGINYNKMLENATVRLDRFFSSAQQTGGFVSSVEKFAALSPVFEMDEAVTGAQRLLEMKYTAAEVVPELAKIGDMVGGVGGNAQTIDRVTLAFKQMVGVGKIQADEMGQLTEANIPAWELLAKAIGKTEAETRKLVEAGRIDANLGVKGIIAAGGDMFKGQSDKAAQTTSGQESQAKSAYQARVGQATKKVTGQYKDALGSIATGLGSAEGEALAKQLDAEMGKLGEAILPAIKDAMSGKSLLEAASAVGRVGEATRETWNTPQQATDALRRGDIKGGLIGNGPMITPGSPADKGIQYAKGKLADWGIIGQDSAKALETGIKAGTPGVLAAGAGLGNAAKDGTKNSLEIKSPSKVMMSAGEDTAEGFVIGFENGKKKIQPITEKDLYKRQYDRADKQGYDDAFKKAAEKTGLPQELLMGIGSRETNMRNIIGDGGRGAGLMQVDIGTDAAFKASGAWKDAEASIIRGAEILKEKFDWLTENAGKTVSVKGNKFTVPKLEGEEKMRTAVAMYNSGAWAPYHVSKGRSPDYGTTGKDYSADVLRRTDYFKDFLGTVTETGPAVNSLSSALDAAKQKLSQFTDYLYSFAGSAPAPKPTGPSIGKRASLAQRPGDGATAKPFVGQIDGGNIGTIQIKSGTEKLTLSADAESASKSLSGLTVSAASVAKPATEATKAIATTAQAATDSTFKVGDYAKAIMDSGSAAKEAVDHFARFKDSFASGIDDMLENGFSKDGLKAMGKNLLKDLSSGLISQATGGKANSVGSLLSGALFGGLSKSGGAGSVAANLPGGFAGGANPASGIGGGGSAVGNIASQTKDSLLSGGLGKLPGIGKVGSFLKGLPGIGGALGKIGGLFGLGGSGAAGAAGAAAGAGGAMGKVAGALGFAGPWGMVAGIGLQFAAPLLGKLFGGDPYKDYKKLVKGEYGISISNQMAGKIMQLGQSKFGDEWKKRKIETVKLPEVRDMLSEYAGAFQKGGNNKLFDSRMYSDQFSAVNQIKVGMRAMGGPVSAGGAYIVGERRPELFIPQTAGRIVPNLDGMSGGGGPWGRMLEMMRQMDEGVRMMAEAAGGLRGIPMDHAVRQTLQKHPDIATDAVDRSFDARSESSQRIREKVNKR